METKDLMNDDQIQQHAELRRAVKIETAYGPALFASFRGLADTGEHVALIYGDLDTDPSPLVRVHSECLTGDVFASGRCDCGEQLAEAQKIMASRPSGIILYLRQEGRGIGLYNKLDAYALQDLGHDTFEANRLLGQPADGRNFKVAAQMLNALGVTSVRLLTNNPQKAFQLTAHGIDVIEIRETGVHGKKTNAGYLRDKALKGGHRIDVKKIGFFE